MVNRIKRRYHPQRFALDLFDLRPYGRPFSLSAGGVRALYRRLRGLPGASSAPECTQAYTSERHSALAPGLLAVAVANRAQSRGAASGPCRDIVIRSPPKPAHARGVPSDQLFLRARTQAGLAQSPAQAAAGGGAPGAARDGRARQV